MLEETRENCKSAAVLGPGGENHDAPCAAVRQRPSAESRALEGVRRETDAATLPSVRVRTDAVDVDAIVNAANASLLGGGGGALCG